MYLYDPACNIYSTKNQSYLCIVLYSVLFKNDANSNLFLILKNCSVLIIPSEASSILPLTSEPFLNLATSVREWYSGFRLIEIIVEKMV